MAGHRKDAPKVARVPSVWFTVWSVLVVVVSAIALGDLAWDQTQNTEASSSVSSPSVSSSPSPTLSASPSPSPTPTPTPSAVVERDVEVWVYNNSRVTGLADRTAKKAKAAGWIVAGWSNWTDVIPRTTVYYPAGKEAQAKLLAEDLGIETLAPITAEMKPNLLTVILTSDE